MRNRRRILLLFVVVISMVALASFVRQSILVHTSNQAKDVLFTDQYRLSGEVNDSLVVVAKMVELTPDSRVLGDAALVAQGDVTVSGQVDGNLTVIADTLHLKSGSHIKGDVAFMGKMLLIDGDVSGGLTTVGAEVTLSKEAQVNGEVIACLGRVSDARVDARSVLPCQNNAKAIAQFASLQALSKGVDLSQLAASGGLTRSSLPFTLSVSLLLTGLAALAVTAFPRHFSHIQEAILSDPRSLAALGFMASLLAIGLCTGLMAALTLIPPVGLILIPIGLLLGLALMSMIIAGWITLALLLGDGILRHLTKSILPPVIGVAFGSLILFTLWHVLALLPFGSVIGLLVMAVLGSTGLGGALATRMGTRPVRRRYFVQG